MPDLRTIQEVNEYLEFCGHCPFELVPAPRKDCQSQQGTASVSGYAPFTEPAGGDDDDLPTIYDTLENVDETLYNGTAARYVSFEDPGDSREALIVETYTDWQGPGTYVAYTFSEDFTSWIADTCGAANFASGEAPNTTPSDVTFTQVSDATACLPTSHLRTITSTDNSGALPTLQGCPGPFGDNVQYYWNFTEEIVTGRRLTDPKTKAQLIADATAEISETWPDPAEGTTCIASLQTTWPLIGSFGDWPACADGPPAASATATAVAVRYRHGVPASYPRADYIAQWDEYFFPAAWDTWDQGGRVGTEPTPVPTLLANRSWTWAGSLAAPWSPWFILAAPATPGQARPVNFLVKAADTPYGNKPTAHGEQYIPT